jgi:hypothetical protein
MSGLANLLDTDTDHVTVGCQRVEILGDRVNFAQHDALPFAVLVLCAAATGLLTGPVTMLRLCPMLVHAFD